MIFEETAAKIVYHLLVMLGTAAFVIVISMAWDWGAVPRKILSKGTVTTRDGQVLQTRKFRPVAKVDFSTGPIPRIPAEQRMFEEELRLPSGRWISCAADCLAAYERSQR